MPDLDVIVLSRDRPDLFAACLDSVERQGVSYHGILIDNGSDGISAGYAHLHGWTVVNLGRNTGFSEGNNIGISKGAAPRVLLLNNDAVLHDDALPALLDHDGGIVSSLNLNVDGTVNHAGGIFTSAGSPRHEGRGDQPEKWACHPAKWATFACALIQRRLLDDVGPMDEGYWYAYEDVDYCLQARRHGWTIEVCADALVTHPELSTRDPRDSNPGRLRFEQKWPDPHGVQAQTNTHL